MFFLIFGIPLNQVLLWNWESLGKSAGSCSTWEHRISFGCLTCSRGCEITDLPGFSLCWSEIIPHSLFMFHFVCLFCFLRLFAFVSCCCLLSCNFDNLDKACLQPFHFWLHDSLRDIIPNFMQYLQCNYNRVLSKVVLTLYVQSYKYKLDRWVSNHWRGRSVVDESLGC